MNGKPMKTAVLGCGMISSTYLPTLIQKFKILEVAGCCDANEEAAIRTAERFGLQAMTPEELLADESIELVVNLTPGSAHYETNKQLLKAGKHVYCEKILTLELDEAKELMVLADDKHLYLGAAPDTFLGSAVQTARYVVDSGRIGSVSSCYASVTRDYSFFTGLSGNGLAKGGGIAFDFGVYHVTALISILGCVKEVTGVMDTRKPAGVYQTIDKLGETYTMECENIMAGTLVFENGVVGNLLFDSNSLFTLPERPAVVIHGTEGILYMADPNNFAGEVKVLLKGNTEPFVMQQAHGFDEEYRGVGAAEMAWSIRNGRKNRANKEMAYHAMEILHGIAESGKSKQFCAIQSKFEQMPPLPRGYRNIIRSISREEVSIALN